MTHLSGEINAFDITSEVGGRLITINVVLMVLRTTVPLIKVSRKRFCSNIT